MFHKLLIANRGEVAVRVARACRELSIRTVCAVSSADLDTSWARVMDERVCIGPPAPRESYLQRERIVQAALQTRCSAVHPGWGFLAEDPLFAALCEQHGLTFVGPSPRAMERMGRKAAAKAAMRAAGVPVIPGSIGLLASVSEALAAAEECGYPVLLKADAGGGGRGMRLCGDEAALRKSFPEAAAEAASAFGSGALYLERCLLGGRHVEVQVLADHFGQAVHLGERDCSVQRNHQKLLEESPCPLLGPGERAELGAVAVRAALSIGYVGAGTIEFLRAADGKLYFMEMNTRLQVEHPVSELVSGVDIVHAQLRIAARRPMGLDQAGVRLQGHAIEVRINAEDPDDGFRPSPGRLETFHLPLDLGPGRVRVDTHLAAGDEVPPYYDSLIAKVIAHADTREEATRTLIATLRAARVEGVRTTIPLHLSVLESEAFHTGAYDTRSVPGTRAPATAARR